MQDDNFFDAFEGQEDDVWYLPVNDEEQSVVVRLQNKFFLWQNESVIIELVPKLLEPAESESIELH